MSPGKRAKPAGTFEDPTHSLAFSNIHRIAPACMKSLAHGLWSRAGLEFDPSIYIGGAGHRARRLTEAPESAAGDRFLS
jgi:hypothetical protein